MKIAILKGLESYVKDTRLKKALAVFCVLKAQNKSGYISCKKYAEAAQACHMTTRTFYTRLKDLRKYNLIAPSTGHGYDKFISLTSWQTVMKQYNITERKFTYVKNSTRPHLIFDVLFIKTLEPRQQKAALRKVNNYITIHHHLEQVTGKKSTEKGFLAAVLTYQLALYRAGNNEHETFLINASTSPSHRTMKKHFDFSSNATIHYKMQTLIKHGLLEINGREQQIHNNCYPAKKDERPRIGNIFYDRTEQARKLKLTNQLKFFPKPNFEKN